MNLLDGVRYFFGAFDTAFSPPVRKFMLLPAAVSLTIIVIGLWAAFGAIGDFSLWLKARFDVWPEVIDWIVEPLLYLLGLLIGAWLFGFLAAIIGGPFLGDLSLHVDTLVRDEVPWYRQIGPAVARELRKLVYILPRLIGLLLLGLVPVVNLVAPVLWVVFGAWLMAVQFCDYAIENRERPFLETLETLRANRALAIGFGACATVGMAVPLLNFLVAPVAVIGATRMMVAVLETRRV